MIPQNPCRVHWSVPSIQCWTETPRFIHQGNCPVLCPGKVPLLPIVALPFFWDQGWWPAGSTVRPHEHRGVQQCQVESPTLLGQGNPEHEYKLVDEWLESSPEEKELGILASEKLQILRSVVSWAASRRGWQQGERGNCPPLFCPCEVPSEVLHPGLGSPSQDMELLKP